MKITLTDENKLAMAVDPRRRRRTEWRRSAEDKVKARRRARLDQLGDRQSVIEAAIDQYRMLENQHVDVALHPSALRISPPRPLPPALGGAPWPDGFTGAMKRAFDVRTRRPLGQMVASRTTALNTYLSMLYVLFAEQPKEPIDRHPLAKKEFKSDVPWSTFAGRTASTVRATRERMRRDLGTIENVGLIHQKAMTAGSGSINFLSETGDGSVFKFTDPLDVPDALVLPSTFFTNGWNLVLTDDEILLWLAINDGYRLRRHERPDYDAQGVPMTQGHRYQFYGLSGEAYGALHELEEFGLITVHDPMPTRSKGKFEPPSAEDRERYEAEGYAFHPVPYQLKPAVDPFARPAVYEVARRLDNELPPRMLGVDPMVEFIAEAGKTGTVQVTAAPATTTPETPA